MLGKNSDSNDGEKPFIKLQQIKVNEAGYISDEEEEDDGQEKDEVKVKIYKQTVPNIHKFWIQLVPEKKEFIDRVLQTFTTGLEQI